MKQKEINNYLYILVVFVISYFLIESIMISLVISFVSMILIYNINKLLKHNKLQYKNIDNVYQFSNYMNIQMINSSNIYEAYKSIESYLPETFQNLSDENFIDEINQIADEYSLNGFSFYAKTINLFVNNGGDYFMMMKTPTETCQKTKVMYNKLLSQKKAKIIEIFILYVLWIFVILFLKLGLGDLFDSILSNKLFTSIIAITLLCGISTFCFACMEYLKNDIKGL